MPAPRAPRRAALVALLEALAVLAWIPLVLLAAEAALPTSEIVRQIVLGAATWGLLAVLLARRTPLERLQTGVVVVLATLVEYTFSPLLQAYVYRIGTVPAYVPPGHGLVYLGALALGRALPERRRPVAVAAVLVVGGAWAVLAALGPRHDVLGLFWFACLAGFLCLGRSTGLYVGAFVVVSWLELIGTHLGVWAWAATDPVLHVIGQGNPPSGAAGGYGWFDLWAQAWAPGLLVLAGRARGALSAATAVLARARTAVGGG